MKTCPKCGQQTDMPFHTCSKPSPTDNELNLAVCEWMGIIQPWKWGSFVTPSGCLLASVPNYLSDDSPRRLLNDAEARLTHEQYMQFSDRLYSLEVARVESQSPSLDWKWLSSPARQRVIAILQTVKPEVFQ